MHSHTHTDLLITQTQNDVVPRASMSSVVELVHELAGAKERLCEEHKVKQMLKDICMWCVWL